MAVNLAGTVIPFFLLDASDDTNPYLSPIIDVSAYNTLTFMIDSTSSVEITTQFSNNGIVFIDTLYDALVMPFPQEFSVEVVGKFCKLTVESVPPSVNFHFSVFGSKLVRKFEPGTISTVGTGESLINSGVHPEYKLKSIVAGTDITFTVSSTEITINSIGGGGGSTLWQRVGSFVNPILMQPIVGDLNLDLQPSAAANVFIQDANDCSAVSSTGSLIRGSHNAVWGCRNCTTSQAYSGGGQRAQWNAWIACDACTQLGNQPEFNAYIACVGCTFETGACSAYIANRNISGIVKGEPFVDAAFVMAGCEGPMNIVGDGSGPCRRSVVLAAQDVTITGGHHNMLIKGSKISVTNPPQNGATVLADHITTGPALAALPATFSSRHTGGYQFWTNDLLTIGVSMAGGANAWASVCDANVKENIVPVDTAAILQKALAVPVNTYNYIGCVEEQVCIGPTAQAYHAQFGTAHSPTRIGVWDPDLPNPVDGKPTGDWAVHENGVPVTYTKPAKDPLCIETMDFLGILLASVQALHARVVALEAAIVPPP